MSRFLIWDRLDLVGSVLAFTGYSHLLLTWGFWFNEVWERGMNSTRDILSHGIQCYLATYPEGGLLVRTQQCCVQEHVQLKTSPLDADLLIQKFIFSHGCISLFYLNSVFSSMVTLSKHTLVQCECWCEPLDLLYHWAWWLYQWQCPSRATRALVSALKLLIRKMSPSWNGRRLSFLQDCSLAVTTVVLKRVIS